MGFGGEVNVEEDCPGLQNVVIFYRESYEVDGLAVEQLDGLGQVEG